MTPEISGITIYPLKSGKGNQLTQSTIEPKGLINDRRWAVIGTDLEVLTARKFPKLLTVNAVIEHQKLTLEIDGETFVIAQNEIEKAPEAEITIFNNPVNTRKLITDVNAAFSRFLEAECQLHVLDPARPRQVKEKYGGQPGDHLSLADACPILLCNEASLIDVNQQIGRAFPMERYRPNLVMKSNQAFIERDWKYIRIGECEFDVAQSCARCVMTTIDPSTGEKDKEAEPLRTLAKYQRDEQGKAVFGVHLIPRKFGTIKLGDKVEVIK